MTMGEAYELSKKSMAAIEGKDRDGWLALFEDDAVLEDPIGVSPFDPDGKGQRGKEAIGTFYDTVIANAESMKFHIKDTYDCGVEVANVGEIHITIGGNVGICRLVSTYKSSPNGKLAALRAYWEFDKLSFD
jgi:steroid Delta-isomerase